MTWMPWTDGKDENRRSNDRTPLPLRPRPQTIDRSVRVTRSAARDCTVAVLEAVSAAQSTTLPPRGDRTDDDDVAVDVAADAVVVVALTAWRPMPSAAVRTNRMNVVAVAGAAAVVVDVCHVAIRKTAVSWPYGNRRNCTVAAPPDCRPRCRNRSFAVRIVVHRNRLHCRAAWAACPSHRRNTRPCHRCPRYRPETWEHARSPG